MTSATDDEREAVGPWLERFVGTKRRRRWIRRLLGPPTLVLRWLATRGSTTHESVRAERPSRPAPALGVFAGAQTPSLGAGPGVHRTYTVRVPGAANQVEEAIARLVADPNLHCTIEIGSFETADDRADVRLDAEPDVTVALTGPYDGPVRVVELTDTQVRLQTREDHVEAGQILFETSTDNDDLVFTIASWTRSRDRLVDLLYRGGPARWLQQHMWISVCRQVALGAGATDPHVTIRTEWLPPHVHLLGEQAHD